MWSSQVYGTGDEHAQSYMYYRRMIYYECINYVLAICLGPRAAIRTLLQSSLPCPADPETYVAAQEADATPVSSTTIVHNSADVSKHANIC
eukprot:COSAG06_NODE_2467_length_6812_cov_3.322211_3_plen_91_part_00